MKRLLTLWLLLLALSPVVAEQSGPRKWKSAAGSEIEASLISSSDTNVVLEKPDGKRLTLTLSQLSAPDQEFIKGLKIPVASQGATTVPDLEAVPGKPSGEILCKADPTWSYYLYLPSAFHTGKKWPVCFIMASGGGLAGILGRYSDAAEHLGLVLAISRQSKNGFADSQDAMMAMSKDVYARLPILEKFTISTGSSGGSRMAYLMSELDDNVAGVLGSASGSGVYLKNNTFRSAKIRPGVVVSSVIGTNDFARREATESHTSFDKNARLIWFPGGHVLAPPDVVVEGMSHIYGWTLRLNKDPAWNPLRAEFAAHQLTWAKAQIATAPATAYRWTLFLSEFPGNPAISKEAATLAADLAKQPTVALSLKADKTIEAFAKKYFTGGVDDEDKLPNPAREKEAQQKAKDFPNLPQSEILTRFGQPSK